VVVFILSIPGTPFLNSEEVDAAVSTIMNEERSRKTKKGNSNHFF